MRGLHAFFVLALFASLAEARPYRVMTARTARTTDPGDIELGLRYQGLLLGEGRGFDPGNFHQLAMTFRVGLLEFLMLDVEASGILSAEAPNDEDLQLAPGDLKLSLQARLVETNQARFGIFFGAVLPTGPSEVDLLPPFFADGTLDFEGLLLLEIGTKAPVRLILDGGFLFQGERDRGALGDFDVPDAIRYDIALAFRPGERALFAIELNGRHYLDPVITPLWTENDDIIELTPGFRFETGPGLVLEVGAGIALNDDTEDIYKLRVHAGFTYEFSAKKGASERENK